MVTDFLLGLLLLGVMVGCTWTACSLVFSDYIASHPVRIPDASTGRSPAPQIRRHTSTHCDVSNVFREGPGATMG